MSSGRDFTVYIRVRPPDSETQQYQGGLTVQDRRAHAARGMHDNPHDVVTVTSGSLEGRRVPSAVQKGVDGANNFNIATVQQVKITVPSASTFVPQAGGGKKRSGSADPPGRITSARGNKNTTAAASKLSRSSSAKVGSRNTHRGQFFTPEKQMLQQQQQQQEQDGGAGFSAAAPVRCARHVFEFDACFCSNPEHPAYADQNKMFSAVGKPAVDHALRGFNVSMLMYGATGAGKTHTMFGAHRNPDFLQQLNNHQQQQQQQTTTSLFGTATTGYMNKPKQVQPQTVVMSARQQQQHKLFEERGLVYRVAEALCNKMHTIRRSSHSSRGKSRSMSAAHGVSEEPEPRRPLSQTHQQQQQQTFSAASSSMPPTGEQHHNVMTVTVSFFEIYCDKIWCLLNPGTGPLRVREHKTTGPFVEGLEEVPVTSVEDVYRVVERGTANRHFAATLHNHHSSRSHALLLFHIHQRQRANFASEPSSSSAAASSSSATMAAAAAAAGGASVFLGSKLYMVDLAGSERVSPHDDAETAHRSEARYINSSLSVLGKVITALAQVPSLARKQLGAQSGGGRRNAGAAATKAYVPYRDSVFTRLLQDSFGGNSKTFMVAAVSPELKDLEETVSTLKYASRARFIQNRPVVNSALQAEDRDRDAIIESLARRVEELEAQLSAAQGSATAVQLAAAASALAQGLHEQHEQAATTTTTTSSSSVDPSTRATSQQQQQNHQNYQQQHQQQQQQQAVTMVMPSSSSATVQVGSVRWNNSPASTAEGGGNNPLYQELLQRSNQQQAMLERIEERETLLLKILMSNSNSGVNEVDAMFSPPQLMRGPTATPGPAKKPSSSSLQGQEQPMVALFTRRSNSSSNPSGAAVAGAAESRSASANSNKTAHFAPNVVCLRKEGEEEEEEDAATSTVLHKIEDKENEKKFITHVLHHHPPSSNPQQPHHHHHHLPFERDQQQPPHHHQAQLTSMLNEMKENTVGGSTFSHLVKTPTRASRSSTTSTVAGSPEMQQQSENNNNNMMAITKSPSVTPPPNATPIHHHHPVNTSKNRSSSMDKAASVAGSQEKLFANSNVLRPAPVAAQPQYRSNAPRVFSNPPGPKSFFGSNGREGSASRAAAEAAAVPSAVDEKRASLLARAEALRKRKSELQQKWSEVQKV